MVSVSTGCWLGTGGSVQCIAAMLTGDEPVTEAELLRREIEVALELVVLPANQDRMRHMLATNKPLEN